MNSKDILEFGTKFEALGSLDNNTTRSDETLILKLLQDGKHLSELDMFKYGYGTSFRSRISNLRQKGYAILDYWVERDNGRKYKKYYLEKSAA